MQAPKDAVEFKKMVVWLKEQGQAGKKIHIGCIGGHGRTGTLLAALVKEVTGNVDAIAYVRKNYCAKAVESNSQSPVPREGVRHQGTEGREGLRRRQDLQQRGSKEFIYDSKKGYTVEKPTQTGKFNSRYGDLFKGRKSRYRWTRW